MIIHTVLYIVLYCNVHSRVIQEVQFEQFTRKPEIRPAQKERARKRHHFPCIIFLSLLLSPFADWSSRDLF